MFIVMEKIATTQMVARVCYEITQMGLSAHPITGALRTAIAVTGNKAQVDSDRLLSLPGVKDIIHITEPYRLAGREYQPEDTIVDCGRGVKVGGTDFLMIAGPCSVESREQTMIIAEQISAAGIKVFRGGAFKPRTSPYTFQGLGKEGLQILAEVREKYGMLTITEAIDTDTVDQVVEYADIVQIGARNMQNYSLLKKAGRLQKPVLLKRGMWASIEELLMSAEYVLAEGNKRVILCERGVRTIADHSRYTLDLAAIPYVKSASHLPIIADPSHGTGRRDKVLPLSRAAIAVGADGLMVEVHHQPEKALSDGPQAITPADLTELMRDIRNLAPILNRVCP
ncbi:MAG TPA: 3-deoxy-7-phosphoheptulonate synthase [Candidatus Acidoferrum sp.]|nr:3-deoxy-7-phosphoheptulonate synthase [Candidatus Acidoferrum sp.]